MQKHGDPEREVSIGPTRFEGALKYMEMCLSSA